MRRTKLLPEVNAGSMADIAFLLLVFFLVTAVIPKDQGIQRKLPKECPPGIDCSGDIYERNILRIAINSENEIMVNNLVTPINEVKNITKTFIDNNGNGSCTYCSGNKSNISSDHPTKAIISLQNTKLTSYSKFIAVQDEITKAYFELRSKYSENVLKKSPEMLSEEDIKTLKKVYPFILSETEIK
ncbi:biopolymer transporter ExbD [Postechiella marina]|uniref:Biopolymer transporter ExbD n=1 Tax=Postechiella marina TaxID=943941 RepID=A0ABP8C2A0_9FLAO